MSTQPRKKSSSFTALNVHNKTIQRDKNINNKLSVSKSVHAFGQTLPSKQNNRNESQRQFQKSNTQRYASIKKRTYEDGNKNFINNDKTINTGQSYKQAIYKRKKKSLSITNTSYKKGFNQQLLSTIEVFQQTLCSLPLDKLILSQNPFYWVQEQIKTLQKLRDKFFRVQKSLKQETRGYYVSKLQNVTTVLINIKDNLETLSKMSMLKNYMSGGTSLDSRNSQSTSSLGWKNSVGLGQGKESINSVRGRKIDENNFEGLKVNLHINGQKSPHFSIDSNHNDNKQNEINHANIPNYFSKQKLVKSQLQSEQIAQKDNLILRQYQSGCTSQQDMRVIINCKTSKSFKSHTQSENDQQLSGYNKRINNGGNHFNQDNNNVQRKSDVKNRQQEKQKLIANNDSMQLFTKKAQSVRNMNKTISKYQLIKQNTSQSQQINRKYCEQQTFNTLQQNNEHTLQQSIQIGQQTKRCYPNISSYKQFSQANHKISENQQQEIKKLKQQLSIKNQILISLQNRQTKQVKFLQAQFGKKQKHYLQTIYQLKTQCEEKELSIRKLLIEKQQQSQQLQMALKQLKTSIQSTKEHTNKQNILSSSVEALTNQIRQFKIREEQLRETVQLERQRTKKTLKQIQQLQSQIQQINNSLFQKQNQIKQIKNENLTLINKNQQLLLETKKIESKQDIYKMKYFKLYSDFDLFKQKVTQNQNYWKKICLNCKREYMQADKNNDSQKGMELRELINFHKRQLLQ